MRTLSQGNSEAVPSQAGTGVLGSSYGECICTQEVSSTIIGQAIGPPRHWRPRRSGTSAGSAGPLGNQSCFWAVPPIDSSQRAAAFRSRSSFGFRLIQTLSLLVFHQTLEFFHFLCLCWFFPLLYPFKTIIENTVFNTNPPGGFLAMVSISIILYFIPSPSPYLQTPRTSACWSLQQPQTSELHLRLYFQSSIWPAQGPESLNKLLTGNWIVLHVSEWSLLFSPNCICWDLTCQIFQDRPSFK